jgi:hypothetical protein
VRGTTTSGAYTTYYSKDDGSVLGTATNKGWVFGARGDSYSGQNDLFLASYWNGSTWNQAFNINASGYVGIGSASMTSVLDVYSSGTSINVAQFDTQNSSTGGFVVDAAAGNWMRFIPNSAAGAYNNINQGSDSALIFSAGTVGTGNLVIAPWASTTSGIRITSSGTVLIGTASSYSDGTIGLAPLQTTAVNGSNAGLTVKLASGSSATAMVGFVNSNGTVGSITTSGSSTAYNTTSDRRLKENINPSSRGLNEVLKIPVEDFNFIADPKKERMQGFIAQELYKVYPEAVTPGSDDATNGKTWSVDYGRVTPLLLKAIQELKADNDNLRAANDNLAAQMKSEHASDVEAIKELRDAVEALKSKHQ